MTRRRALMALAALAALAVLAAGGYFGGRHWLLQRRADPAGQPRAVEVPAGGVTGVARALAEAGVVDDPRLFSLAARLTGDQGPLKAGEYELSADMPAARILEKLRRGEVLLHRVTLPEGWTARQVVARLAQEGLVPLEPTLALLADREFIKGLGLDAPDLEGYLFPDTYLFSKGLGGRAVLAAMARRFQAAWAPLAPAAAAAGLDRRSAVTLASIIEKETSLDAERPLVSAVYHNRLKQGMRLQADPTVIYGIPDFDGNLTRAHLAADTPYNTYLRTGLPAGPICNPGRASLEAAVRPAAAPYLYFVARGDGSHHFSATYREQVNAVNRYQRRR